MQETGGVITTEIYIEVFKIKLKELFPPLTNEQFVEDLKLYKQKEEERILEIQKQAEKEDAKKKKGGKKENTAAPETDASQVPIQRRPYYTKGWILLGFPNSYHEAKDFEHTLSGFMLEEELLNSEAESRKQRAQVIVEAPVKPPTQKKFIEGGIDCAIKLDISQEESLKRALGRRIDPKTGNIYHLQDNPPPVNDNNLLERLVPVNDPENTEDKLKEIISKYDDNKQGLEAWLSMFGNEDLQIDCLQSFDGFEKADEVQERVEQHLEKILEYKIAEKYEKVLEEDALVQRAKAQENQNTLAETNQENTTVLNAEGQQQVAEEESKVYSLIVK